MSFNCSYNYVDLTFTSLTPLKSIRSHTEYARRNEVIWFGGHCASHGGKSEQVDDLEQVSSEMPEDELDDELIHKSHQHVHVLEDFNSVSETESVSIKLPRPQGKSCD